jgi:ArsR family transcriptional regulator, arsenate/arsenite/antimonite-responsive transcriptional repressor
VIARALSAVPAKRVVQAADMPTQMLARSSAPQSDRGGQLLRALAEPMRWQIVQLLAREQLCVCHLTEELEVGQPLVSHHLKVLREAGLIEGERFRYWTYYRLVPGAFGEIASLLNGLPTDAGQRERRPCL